MAENPTIIVGHLDDSELLSNIDRMVNEVDARLRGMTDAFDRNLQNVVSILQGFNGSLDLQAKQTEEVITRISTSMSGLAKAMATSGAGSGTGGGGGGAGTGTGTGSTTEPETVGELKKLIALENQRRDALKLESDELEAQNKKLAEQQERLKTQLMTQAQLEEYERKRTEREAKKAQAPLLKEFNAANSLSTKTLVDAEKKLARLNQVIDDMRKKGIFDEVQINRVQQAIDRTTNKIDTLKRKLANNPVTLADVLKMPERSVQEVADKMRALKKVISDPTSGTHAQDVSKISSEYQRLSRLQAELLGRNVQLTHSNNYLAQSFGYIRNRIVYALTLGALTSFVKQVYEVRAQYELLERSLGVLVGSFERGSQVFAELSEMALKSPFTLMELGGAAKQLTAYNFAANEVVDTTRRLADLSAALGVPMERLTYNLGQIRAQTVLTARDARDFANAGLPIVKSLADHFSELEGRVVSTGEVYSRMSKKMVSYSDVMAVLNELTDEGGKFFDFQAKQAQTLKVQMANLSLAWNNALNDIGKSNHSLLTAPIRFAKSLFEGWRTIDHAIKAVVATMGMVKLMQVVAVAMQWKWAQATQATATQMDWVSVKLGGAISKLLGGLKAMATNPWTWVFAVVGAAVDLAYSFYQASEATEELNNNIRKAATESADSLQKFFNNKGNVATRDLAREMKLTASQGANAWEALSDELLASSASANSLLAELVKVDDINQRVSLGFDYASRIRDVEGVMAKMGDDAIKVSQTMGTFGIFGEGLVDDLKDYKDALDDFTGTYETLRFMLNDDGKSGNYNAIKAAYDEMSSEIDVTANSIKNFMDLYNITDPLQMREILERARAQIKIQNPKLSGELGNIFDIELDKKLSELTNGAISANESLWDEFTTRLRRRASAFSDITDKIYDDTYQLTEKQNEAIEETLADFQKSMPQYYEAVKQMVTDASKLKIRIGLAFNVNKLNDFQKEVNERIAHASKDIDFGTSSMLPTQKDDFMSWVDTQQKAIKNLNAENKRLEKDQSEWSRLRRDANNKEIAQRTNLLNLFGQSVEEEKKSNKQKDIAGEAFANISQAIDAMRKRYKEYRDMGVNGQDALNKATQEYSNTLTRNNATLRKLGVTTKSTNDIAKMDLRDLRDYYTELLESAKRLNNAKGIETLEKSLANINVEITKIDYKRVVDGLNSELDKLKSEYELAVDMDATPEMGEVFKEMMGLSDDDVRDLPRTYNQVVARLQKGIDKVLKDANISETFNLVDSLNADKFKEWVEQNGHLLDDNFVKALDKIRKYASDLRLKESKSQIEEWSKLVEKYGDIQAKMMKIYKDNAEQQLTIVRRFGDDEDVEKALDLTSKIKLSQDPAEITRLQDELAKILEKVTKGKPIAMQALDATNKEQEQGISKVWWESFKDSDLYAKTFENLENVSTNTIDRIIERLNELKEHVKEDPASMKALMQALEDAEKMRVKRNPFAGIISGIKEWSDASETLAYNRKQLDIANKAVINAEIELNRLTEDSSPNEVAKATNNLTEAKKRQAKAEINVANAENAVTKAQAKVISSVDATAKSLQSAEQVFSSISDIFREFGDNETADAIDDITKGFKMLIPIIVAVGVALEALKAANVWLLAISAALSAIYGVFNFISNRKDRKITKQIEESERAVKNLEIAYKRLQNTINKAMGDAETSARRAAVANKQLQLTELRRQLMLEQSRTGKKYDEDKVIDLRSQIADAEIELQNMIEEVTSSLFGEDIKSAAESFVDTWVEAWREGETTLDKIEEKMDEITQNIIKKAITSKIVGNLLQPLYDMVDQYTQEASAGGMTLTTNELMAIARLAQEVGLDINDALGAFYKNLESLGIVSQSVNKETELSDLQAGIKGITEEQASALEAYWNANTQQQYVHSELLTQIRDAILEMQDEMRDGIHQQILAQLQATHVIQVSIQSALQGALNPSGRAFMVELTR